MEFVFRCIFIFLNLYQLLLVLSLGTTDKSSPSLPLYQVLFQIDKIPWAFFVSCWTIPALSASPYIADALAAYTSLWPFNVLILVKSISFLDWGSQHSRAGPISTKKKKMDHLPLPTGNTVLHVAWEAVRDLCHTGTLAGLWSACCPSWSQGSFLQSWPSLISTSAWGYSSPNTELGISHRWISWGSSLPITEPGWNTPNWYISYFSH